MLNRALVLNCISYVLAATTFAQSPCLENALSALSEAGSTFPDIYSRLTSEHQLTAQKFLNCETESLPVSLTVFVHEGIHLRDSELSKKEQAYTLISNQHTSYPKVWVYSDNTKVLGKTLNVLSEVEKKQDYVGQYLKGKIGGQRLDSLLGELNAYAHELETAKLLPPYKNASFSKRDGVMAMILFTLKYYQ